MKKKIFLNIYERLDDTLKDCFNKLNRPESDRLLIVPNVGADRTKVVIGFNSLKCPPEVLRGNEWIGIINTAGDTPEILGYEEITGDPISVPHIFLHNNPDSSVIRLSADEVGNMRKKYGVSKCSPAPTAYSKIKCHNTTLEDYIRMLKEEGRY